jgi:NarL family two-component system sensor histidine kinase LiaS
MSEIEKIILIMVVVFTICLTLMGILFFLLINNYRKSIERKKNEALNNLIVGQDNERERLARDLHDQMGPQINAIAAYISSVKADNTEIQEVLNESKEELWKASQELRNISHDLMSTSLRKYGLIEAVRKMIERSKDQNIVFEIQTNSEGENLNDQVCSHFYRIIQELMYNSIKHSGASNASIDFNINDETKQLIFTYSDNGKGNPDFDLNKSGIGISNIKTRVMLMKGKVDFNLKNGFMAEINVNY